MKIELEYPYNQDWDKGYLVTNPEGRKTVILYNSHNKRSSTAYARYLISVKEGRYLSEGEEVDHINDDRTDDRLENLQILSSKENRDKQIAKIKLETDSDMELCCPVCNSLFKYKRSNYRYHIKNGRNKFYCSRDCQYKGLKLPRNSSEGCSSSKKVTDEDIFQIKQLILEGLSAYKISGIMLHISRATIGRYMKRIKEGLL